MSKLTAVDAASPVGGPVLPTDVETATMTTSGIRCSMSTSNSSFNRSHRASKWIGRVTRAEKVLFVALTTVIGLCLVFITCILFLWGNQVNQTVATVTNNALFYVNRDDVCLTPLCVESASEIIKRMNNSVDPCEDFYGFACGGLDNTLNIIPDDKSSISTAQTLQFDIDKRLKVLLENIKESNESNYRAKMATLYRKCMNVTEHEELAEEPIKYVLGQLGGWPVVEGQRWNSSNFTLENVLVDMKRMGYKHDLFSSIEVMPHVLAHKYNLIYIGSADLGLEDRSYYLDEEYNDTMTAYLNFMVDAAMVLGAENETEVREEMDQVLQFEKRLAKLMLPRDTHTNILNYMNLSMISELAPAINWTKYLNGVFYPYIYIPEEAFMIVKNPSYVSNMSTLLSETDSRTLANYINWRIVLESTSILSEKWARMGRKLWIKLDGRPQLKAKWLFCVGTVKRYFQIGMSALYINNLHQDHPDQVLLVKQIVDYIMKAFEEILKENTWMDSLTIKEAVNKTRRMKIHAGFPIELLNDTAIDKEYELARTKMNWSFFSNVLMLRRWRMDIKYMKVQFDNSKGHWLEYAKVADVNAYYRSQENSIEFPISIIEAMRIHKDKPMYLNFGDIGWVIGHEITHGFDNMGRHFDGEGEYRSWWTNDTDSMYEQKTKCFSQQYSSYQLKDSKQLINGNLTLGENIADNGGLKQAFRAYQDYVNQHGQEKRLPGLPFSPEQLFFIQSASFYCGRHRKQITEYSLKTDTHAPNAFRIIGTMSNMQSFAETFECKPGSQMNPEDKCSLW